MTPLLFQTDINDFQLLVQGTEQFKYQDEYGKISLLNKAYLQKKKRIYVAGRVSLCCKNDTHVSFRLLLWEQWK